MRPDYSVLSHEILDLNLEHMYLNQARHNIKTEMEMELKFGFSQSERVRERGSGAGGTSEERQASSVSEKKILASRSHVISKGTSCPQPPYPPFDLVCDGIGEPHCSTCRFTISLNVLLASSMTKTRVFRAGSKRFL